MGDRGAARVDRAGESLLYLWRPRLAELLLTAGGVAVVLVLFLQFTGWVESRSGATLEDPLLQMLPATDLSWPIFGVIYGALIAALVLLGRRPDELLHLLRAYGLLVLVRIAAMWATPLDPPAGMILLVDPLAGVGPGGALTRDLFFSGHTATMVLLALGMRRRSERILFGAGALILASMLLLQHVHYTIDVLAAPFFAAVCFRLTSRGHIPGP